MVSKEATTPIHDIYGWAVTEFLYYATYIVESEQRKIKELRKIKLKK